MTSVTELSSLDDLLDHARSSRWRGTLVSPTHRGRVRNATCGDEVSLELEIVADRVEKIRFQGRGCFLSQATASLLCERVSGAHLDALRSQTPSELLGFHPNQLSTNRQRCCLLAVEAWQQVLRELK
ncbi:iron-sulfur cluster assembly scaffold protein [Planctomicrobium sp. SH527]|uniref:iron-sulfur cluster assembly scaffold protein n=1 Tax=Planctomicrobium sp. SH527 TaxID=3448123 RepID=UPI003F5B0518